MIRPARRREQTKAISPKCASLTYGSVTFVAVGRRTILTSTNGIFWANLGTSETLNGVQYDGNRFVALGDSGVVLNSLDGTVWSEVAHVADRPAQYLFLTYANGLCVAGSSAGTWISTNGLVWTNADLPLSGVGCLTHAKDTFVLVGGPGRIFTSRDGQSWTRLTEDPYPVTGFAYGNRTFVATAVDQALTSPEGVEWTARATGDPLKANSLTFAGDYFFSLATSLDFDWGTTNALLRSSNGLDWTRAMAWTNTMTSSLRLTLPTSTVSR